MDQDTMDAVRVLMERAAFDDEDRVTYTDEIAAVTRYLDGDEHEPFKVGDRVQYRDGDPRTFIVYQVYSPEHVSLALAEYPDTEQDFLTNVSEIRF